jgi:hypothetical protein
MMKEQDFFRRSKVLLRQKIIAFCLVLIISLTSFSFNSMGFSTPVSSGIDITYEINVTVPPEAKISVIATYKNVSSPLVLSISYSNYPERLGSLDNMKNLELCDEQGKNLSWRKIDYRMLSVDNATGEIKAKYEMDPGSSGDRTTKVEMFGGVIKGLESFLLPESDISSIKVKINVPTPWSVVSVYPKVDDWFTLQPYVFQDLRQEMLNSAYFFGVIDYDKTKQYEDGFEIRVVGFKYQDYEHWNVYSGGTPLDEALRSADDYYSVYRWLKNKFGEYPLPKLLLVGSDYWQGGGSAIIQMPMPWFRFEESCHAPIHAYFGLECSRIISSGSFFPAFKEGYTTYSEGFLASEISGQDFWKGALYERKFQYIRGKKYQRTEEDSWAMYVAGFLQVFLMDKEIRRETSNTKNINDLMVAVWHKFNGPNLVTVSDEQILGTLKELTGNSWQWFYDKYITSQGQLDASQLDDLKPFFDDFLEVYANLWYGGKKSPFFITQELVTSAGHFTFDVRVQDPMTWGPNIADFVLAARKYKDISKSDLTERDIEEILHLITGKDHTDFFEFYKEQGYTVDPREITDYVRQFSFVWRWNDNAVKLSPNAFPLGKSTNVIGEIVDQDFANSDELLLQVQVYDKPVGLTDIRDLITGKGVSYQGSQDFPSCTNYFFNLPKAKIGDKTYTFFTINLPMDAGVIKYYFSGQPFENPPSDFIGLKKVKFQSGSTFWIKPSTYENIDTIAPVLSVTEPGSSEIVTDLKTFCIKGLVEPEAKVLVNGKEAVLSSNSFEWSSCIELQPGENTIKIEVSDKASNTVKKEIKVTLSDTLPPELIINSPLDNYETNENTITVSGTATDKESGISKVNVNGISVTVSSSGSFSTKLNLTEGNNRITVIAIDNSENQTTKTINVTYSKQVKMIILQIGNSTFTVNGVSNNLDSPPIIKNSRTLLPIRAVVEALGGTASWDASTKKVTVTLGSNTIELWIGKSIAKVNGIDTSIDSTNSKVVPEIINSRTMLPLRFVTENLGCDVQWDGTTKTITITYQGG